MTCEHENIQASVGVAIEGFSAEIRVWCIDCDESFVFFGEGLQVGSVLRDRPTISVDGLELRAPLRPQTADPHFGMGLAGIVMRVRSAEQGGTN